MGRINVTPSIFAGASAPNRQDKRRPIMNHWADLSDMPVELRSPAFLVRDRRSKHGFRKFVASPDALLVRFFESQTPGANDDWS